MGRWPFLRRGNPTAPPLVLLHGFMGRGEEWLPVAERLAEHFYCLMPDLPGHGQNQTRLGRWPSLGDWARQLRECLDEEGLAQVHLAGYSLGGRLALRFALAYPHRLQTLVLESASPGLRAPKERAARRALDRQRARELRVGEISAFLNAWYRQPIFALSAAEIAERVQQVRENRWRELALVLESLSPGREPPLWEALPCLSLPVLLIGGGDDLRYSTQLAEMARLLPQAQLVIVEGVGHNVHARSADEWAKIVYRWLQP